MQAPISNRNRLESAGIISHDLTEEQEYAIESLSEDEVDQLISVNDKLAAGMSARDPMVLMPGINPTPGINPVMSQREEEED